MSQMVAVGIDLGTTFSCVAAYQRGSIEIFENDQGNRTTPSVVGFETDRRLIGEYALQKSIANPTNTIYDSKRMLGRSFDDPEIQLDIKNWQFEVVNDDGRPQIQVNCHGKTQSYHPEEISSIILTKMVGTAKTKLGKDVKDAVITVPAYFNDAQRQATKDAATIAGLNTLKLLNEPIAAAIAYGLDKTRQGERKVLIYDLGGGTFDVSLLTVNGQKFSVKTYGGNSHLGGQDFNNRMIEHLVQEFKRKHNKDIANDARAMSKLRDKCESAKRTLTVMPITRIEIENLYEGIPFSTSISRSTFENLNASLFRSTIDEVEKALQNINWNKSSVDDVVLIGGSTRIPKIQELLKSYFNGKHLYNSISPDEAVAYGAAMYAAILTGKDPKLRSFEFTDVTPIALGTDIREEGFFDVIIPQNTRIPAEKTKTYQTLKDNQTSMSVQVLEGNQKMCNDNNMLGNFSLCGLPAQSKGEVKADVTFKIDDDGILHVKAQEKMNCRNIEKIEIRYMQNRLNQEEIDRMAERAERLRLDDERQRETLIRQNQFEQDTNAMLQEAQEARTQFASSSSASQNNSVNLNRVANSSGHDQLNYKKTEWEVEGEGEVTVPIRFVGEVKVKGNVKVKYSDSHLIADNSHQSNQSVQDQASSNNRIESQDSSNSENALTHK